MPFHKIKANISSKVRVENALGRRYLVSNVTLIVEGVLNGVLYPAEELRTFPESWDGRPLPLAHPTNGQGDFISANSRDVIDQQCVGQVFKVHYKEGESGVAGTLAGEAWIDAEQLESLANNENSKAIKLVDKLEVGDPIEVSTGLFIEEEEKEGVFNGAKYETIARNHRPDHLAILVDEVGACSVEDGCGMMVNKTIGGRIKGVLKAVANKLTPNALTARDKDIALADALRQKIVMNPGTYFWVKDYGQDDSGQLFVVYDREERNEAGNRTEGVYRRNFTISPSDQITLSDTEEMVVKKTSYIPQQPQTPVNDSPRTNTETPKHGEPDQMKITEMVAAVIACNSNPFGADQEDVLMKMNEGQLKPLIANQESTAGCGCKGGEPAPVVANTAAGVEEPKAKEAAPDDSAKPAVNADDAPVTMGQLKDLMVNTLPGMIDSAVKAASTADRRTEVLAELKGNAAVRMDDAILETLELPALEGIAKSCGVSVDYSGAGGPRGDLNVNADSSDGIPDMPSIDWSK